MRLLNSKTDFLALANLLNEVAKVDSGPLTTEAEQSDYTAMLHNYGLAKQWVVDGPENTGDFIAHASFFKQPATPYAEFTLTIHPNNRNQDIEKKLLDLVAQEAKLQHASYLYAQINSKNPYFHKVLLSQGFKLERGYHAMEMSLTSSFPEPVLPAEFRLCTYDQVNDIKVILEIINKGWSDLPGHKVADSNNVAWVNQQPQDSIFLLFDDKGKIAGTTSIVMLEDGLGRIDAGGIVPEYRTSDLYRSLALVALEYAVKHGCKKVMLESWGDYESTIEVYKKLGFEITIHELGYRFDIN